MRRVIAISIILIAGFAAESEAVEFAGGTGEPNDPYQIATAEQLMSVGSDPNLLSGHFVLVNDIDLDPNLPGGQVFTQAVIAPGPVDPTGASNEGRFTGRFDGDRHAVRNLRILAVEGSYLGLFGYVGGGGCVENLRLEAAEIAGGSTMGLLAASNGGTLLSCAVAGSIQGKNSIGGLVGENGMPIGQGTGRGPDYGPGRIEFCGSACSVRGARYVGGIVGVNRRGSIACSWADCVIDGGSDVGGLVGNTWQDEISFCYALGQIRGDYGVGGLIGNNWHSIISGCYAQGEVRGNNTVAGLIAENQDGTIYCCYSAAKVTGKFYPAGLISRNHSGVVHLCYWDREQAGEGLPVDGAARTTSQMQSALTFDGWGFLGMWTIDSQRDYPRLAWQGPASEPIRDIAYPYGGGTGEPDAPYRVETAEDLAVLGRHAGDWDKHFAMTADIDLTRVEARNLTPIGLIDIPFTGVFDGDHHTIRGLHYVLPNESYVAPFRYVGRADVDGNPPNGVIRNLRLDEVDVVGADWTAGLVGQNRGLVESCSIDGSVASARGVAGLVAQNLGRIVDCRADVSVLRSDPWVRGIGDAGGLVVHNEGIIRGSCAIGRVDGASGASSTGGLVATNHGGEIENSWASAQVDGFWAAGGLVGRASGTKITRCYASGAVTSSGSEIAQEWAGGLAGSMYGELSSSYATGPVSGNGYVAGLVADNGGAIVSCYATGPVAGPGVLGGLVATGFRGTVESSYWNRQTTGIEVSLGGTPASTEQMMHAATFLGVGWDFENTWTICEGRDYPRLRWEDTECEVQP